MVFYFYPRGWVEGSDDWIIYMGKDKYENEDLIKYGYNSDVWCVAGRHLSACPRGAAG